MTMGSVARRALMASTLAAMVAGRFAGPALAAEETVLFKVVSPRDEIVVGLSAAELGALGAGAPAEALAGAIAARGQMSLWRYTVQRGADGALVMAPADRVGVFAAGVVRIEPYRAAHPVRPPR